jgi:hypothetical protein
MYTAGNEITVTWVLAPTGAPTAESDYDINIIPSTQEGTYTDAGIINYVAPSASYSGCIQYKFTPLSVGRFRLTLSIGTGVAYAVLEENQFWIFPSASSTASTIKVLSKLSYPRPSPLPVVSEFSTVDEIICIASDGSNIVFYGKQASPGNQSGFFLTDHSLSAEPVLQINASDLPFTPTFGQRYTLLEYSPKHGRLVSCYTASSQGLIYSDDLGLSWTLCTFPTWGNNATTLSWDPDLELWYIATLSGATLLVSTDGITWVNQTTIEVLGGAHPGSMYDQKTFNIGNDTISIISQWEEYCYKYNDTGSGSTGWTKTINNGVAGGAGTWPLYNWSTDGSIIVVTAFGSQSHTFNLSDHGAWVEYTGTTLGWHAGNPSITAFAYIAAFDRPWIACVGGQNTNIWYDATDPSIPDYEVSTNPFFAGKSPMRTPKWSTQSGYLNTFPGYFIGIFNNRDETANLPDQIIVGNN